MSFFGLSFPFLSLSFPRRRESSGKNELKFNFLDSHLRGNDKSGSENDKSGSGNDKSGRFSTRRGKLPDVDWLGCRLKKNLELTLFAKEGGVA